ncbi:hypothetical protein SDC9_171258 [bioreactor metagenome]|uniref:Uncharacterized protein n=1 Tax=bioreactor metagenome TaxID=1076179 RepID=A0A645GB54_9ZZZZ
MLEMLVAGVLKVHKLQRLVHAPLSGNPPLKAVILQVLAGAQIGVESRAVRHHPGARPGPGKPGVGGLAEELDLSRGGKALGA